MPDTIDNPTQTPQIPLGAEGKEYVISSQKGSRGSIFSKKIARILIGVFLLLQIVFFSIFFILPRLRPTSEQGEVTLVYWGVWEPPAVMSPIFADFERQHPNVKIKYEKQDVKFLGKYVERLRTRIQNGTGPDVLRFHNSWLIQMKDSLLPFPSDLVNTAELATDKYYDVVKRDLSSSGAFYGIPLHIDTMALFINSEIFKSAGIVSYPTTWDELSVISRQLTVKDEKGDIKTAGVALGSFDNIDHASDIIFLLFLQNGANIRNLEGESRKNAQDALDFYVSFAKGEDRVWNEKLEHSKLAFAKGKLAMFFGYSWDILDFATLNPKLAFTVIPVPHLPGRGTTIASYWAEGVSAKTKHPKEAFELLQFVSQKQTLQRLYEQEAKTRPIGELYSRSDMASLLRDNQNGWVFVEQARDAEASLFAADTFDGGVNAALNGYLGNAVRSVLSGSNTSASAVETLAQGITQVLTRYEQPQR